MKPQTPQALLRGADSALRSGRLTRDDRTRLNTLVASANGRGINLSPRQRVEVSALVAKADGTDRPRTLSTPRIAPRRTSGRRSATIN